MKRDIMFRGRIQCPLKRLKIIQVVVCTNGPCLHYGGKKYGGLYGKIVCSGTIPPLKKEARKEGHDNRTN